MRLTRQVRHYGRGVQREQRCVRLQSSSVCLCHSLTMSALPCFIFFPPYATISRFVSWLFWTLQVKLFCGSTTGSSETVGLRAPGARATVIEWLSSKGLTPLHTDHWVRKFRPEIRSTDRVKSQILNSMEKSTFHSGPSIVHQGDRVPNSVTSEYPSPNIFTVVYSIHWPLTHTI